MFKQMFLITVALSGGSLWSYIALTSFPREIGLTIATLIFGGTLLLLGIYVARNDPQRKPRVYAKVFKESPESRAAQQRAADRNRRIRS